MRKGFPWKLGIEILGRNQEVCCPLTWISKGQKNISFKCMTESNITKQWLKEYNEIETRYVPVIVPFFMFIATGTILTGFDAPLETIWIQDENESETEEKLILETEDVNKAESIEIFIYDQIARRRKAA